VLDAPARRECLLGFGEPTARMLVVALPCHRLLLCQADRCVVPLRCRDRWCVEAGADVVIDVSTVSVCSRRCRRGAGAK
jgi:hypothetical protein